MRTILLCLVLCLVATVRAEEQPNVIVIITDDAGYADFGFTGCEDWDTPHIDRLAREGIVCDAGYVSAAVCSPSRAGLMIGRYQQRVGHEFNLGQGVGLPTHVDTIADAMNDAGYVTGAIGKWHLGSADEYHPLSRGFDEFYGYLSGSRSYFPVDANANRTKRPMRGRENENDPEDSYVTDTLASEASSFIERHAADPFFLYVSFTAVHTPMHATDEDLDDVRRIGSPNRRKLAAMTASLDRAVGRIMETLESTKRADNTLVVFLNDNGGATNNASDNGPFRGMKGSKFEGGVRVPFVIRWPEGLKPGRYPAPVSSLDIMPTAIGAAGGDIPTDLDGVNLLPYLRTELDGVPHERLYWRRGVAAAIREGDWKLVRVETLGVRLYDLASDIGETTDLADAHPDVVARLTQALETWEEGLAEPLWREAPKWTDNQIRKHRDDVRTRDQERGLP